MLLSLLIPPDVPRRDAVRLSDQVVHDLELRSIAAAMAHYGIGESGILRVLADLPQSADEIRYRQQTARCFWRNVGMCDTMEELVRAMQELTVFSRRGQETDRPLLESIWRLGELELYVELVERTADLLDRMTDRSPGLDLLLEEMRSRRSDPAFDELRRELPRLRSGIKLHQSVTIGINLDDKLRPVEAALLGVNEKRFREGQFLSGFLGKAAGDPYVTRTSLLRTGGPQSIGDGRPERLPLAPLFEELDGVLRSMLRPLAKRLRAWVSVNTEIFRRLVPEIAFFLGSTTYLRSIADAGYAMSFPGIMEPDARTTAFRGLYNLRLASHRLTKTDAARMVGNDVGFDDAARIFVLTGPNGGGKTTFTQAVGIATVLGQAGLPIPAVAGEIAPADAIYTHFPTEEDFDDELGRFEDEAMRISTLFDHVTRRSMVLLNEPLASTGPREAERIAESVLAGLCLAGVRGVFTTHFHDLARGADGINRETRGASQVGTLNAGVRYEEGHATRTYEIRSGPPSGSSFAEDVAKRYRIDRESLDRRILGGTPATHRDLA